MRTMRLRLTGRVMPSGETDGGADAGGVVAFKSLKFSCCTTVWESCEAGGVTWAAVVVDMAFFCREDAMSANRGVNSWPSRGLRLKMDLDSVC